MIYYCAGNFHEFDSHVCELLNLETLLSLQYVWGIDAVQFGR
jgi:hypothetical protein